MKPFVKAIIAGGCIILTGIIILIIALGLNGWTFKADFSTKEFYAEQENSEIVVESSVGSVKIKYYDGDKVQIIYPEADNYKLSITEQDGYVQVSSPKPQWYEFSIWWADIPETVINLPKDKVFVLNLTVNAGSLSLEGAYSKVWSRVNAGTLKVKDIVCEEFGATVNAGSLEVATAECDIFGATVNAGSMQIDRLLCATSFSGEVNAGSLNVKGIDCPKITATVKAGSLNMKIWAPESEYYIHMYVSAGSSNICNKGGTTGKGIDAYVYAGSLNIYFTS